MLSIRRRLLYLFALSLVQILGIGIFSKGFFPYKTYLSGFSTIEDVPSSFLKDDLHKNHWQEPAFDRLVFVVIDALRNDFVFGNGTGFDFVKSQIEDGSAIPFTARATAPTVTMPRIKALTTGTIPSFLDAILNIAESDTSSSLDFYDNWVYQLKHTRNKTMHFFGDDTWVRLFPGLFDKMDGTTSFYVSDTVQVDLNVTRHIKEDMAINDWDTTILHYLGLDHVGHLGGPDSPLMLPKQKEMDKAIESIYEIVSTQDADRIVNDPKAKGTLIVVCGDHGMNEKGNHGGSSVGETSAALVFLSPRFQSRPHIKKPKKNQKDRHRIMGHPVVDQIDIVPTLASLFAFPIPKNNLGKVIVDLLKTDDKAAVLRALYLNSFQLGQIMGKITPMINKYINDPVSFTKDDSDKYGKLFAQAANLHKEYLFTKTSKIADESIELYTEFIDMVQSQLANTASDYKLSYMVTGALLMIASGILFCFWSNQLVNEPHWNMSKWFSTFIIISYGASMLASSFIEEEYATWHFFLQTLFLLGAIQSLSTSLSLKSSLYPAGLCLFQMALVRLVTSWNALSILASQYVSKWHIASLALGVTTILAVNNAIKLGRRQTIDVNGTASIIQMIAKAAYAFIITFCSLLVLVYKIRSEWTAMTDDYKSNNVPEIYTSLLDLELVKPLDQVQLGKLIYNYGGASLFVLFGLRYVTKRADLMNIEENRTFDNELSRLLQTLLYTITPILILLSSIQNSGLFLVFHLQYQMLKSWQRHRVNKDALPSWLLGMLVICLCHTSFFATGHSNSIASIDLSNAYVGVEGYNTILIGILTFVSNWSASLWWAVAGWSLVADACESDEIQNRWISLIVIQSAFFSVAQFSLSISVTILREHLFIWTVFSPKYLYQIAWNCLFHWIFQALFGTFLVLFNLATKQETNETETEASDVED